MASKPKPATAAKPEEPKAAASAVTPAAEASLAAVVSAVEAPPPAAEAPAQPPSPAAPPSDGAPGVLVVTGPKRGRWRAGWHFGPEPRRLPLAEMTEDERAAIEGDPALTVSVEAETSAD